MVKVNDPQLTNVLSKLNTLSAEDKNSPIHEFVNKLIVEKKFPELDEAVQKILKEDLMRRLNDFITVRTIAALTDDDILSLNKMLDEKKPGTELQKFVSGHITNYVNFLTATLLEFREVYLGLNPPADVSDVVQTNIPPAPIAPPMPVSSEALKKMN